MGVALRGLLMGAVIGFAPLANAQVIPAPGADALPQISQVTTALAPAGTWAVAAGGGFGLISEEGSHQRLHGSIAGGFALSEGLALGLKLQGRYDKHPDDAQGSDDSLVGEPTLRVRAATALSEQLHLGLDVALLVPGKDAPSLAFDAPRMDARGAFTFVGRDGFGVSGNLGFRFDKTGNAAPTLATTRPGDRVSLGLNDYHALLIGVGAWKRWSRVEALGEISWNPWLGSGAPSVGQAPLHVVGGLRILMGDSLAFEVLLDGLLSGRPEPAANQLVAIDPRFSALVGLRLFGGYAAKAVVAETPPPVETPVAPDPVAAPATARVHGRVTNAAGAGVQGATVTVTNAQGFSSSVQTDDNGAYEVPAVPIGAGTLRVEGPHLKPTERPLDVTAAGIALDVQPEAIPAMGQLRGLVRAFDGRPLAANIAIQPTGQTLAASQDGEFELALPPGEYQVEISINGFRAQSRTVQIEDDGVTLLNVDLKKARR